MKIYFWIHIFFCIILFSGCSAIKEEIKILWGSSTQALEEERSNAIQKEILCELKTCFDTILEFAGSENKNVAEFIPVPVNSVNPDADFSNAHSKVKNLDVFIKDRKKNVIVVMGVPGFVNTTEVGIFLTQMQNKTLIEVTSLSTSAKIKVAEMIFTELESKFESQ